MINLAVVGSPAGNRFPVSDAMKTTERITRLNNDMWLYEIRTEDPVILTRPFTVRYPMRNDPNYQWWEYACHEGNTIIANYVTTSRFEREHPTPEHAKPIKGLNEVVNALNGRWVGRPRIVTVDLDIELEFDRNPDGTVREIDRYEPGKDRQAPAGLRNRRTADEFRAAQHAAVDVRRRALRRRHHHRGGIEQHPGQRAGDVQEALEDQST